MLRVETSGKSVEEAVSKALQQLGLDRTQVDVEVVSEPRSGILGVGAQPARVIVTPRPGVMAAGIRPAAPAGQAQDDEEYDDDDEEYEDDDEEYDDEDDEYDDDDDDDDEEYDDEEDEDGEDAPPPPVARPVAGPPQPPRFAPAPSRPGGRPGPGGPPPGRGGRPPVPTRPRSVNVPRQPADPDDPVAVAVALLEDMLELLGLDVEVHARPPETVGDGSVNAILDIRGEDDLSVLVGRRGETLASLQYLVNLMLNRRVKTRATVGVDVGGYRRRREDSLRSLARRMADRVKANGQSITLEPMPPNERRIVHLTLADHPDVLTISIGEGESRKVAITPRR